MSETMAIQVAPISRVMFPRMTPSPQDRSRAKRKLFGEPEQGEISEIYRQEELRNRVQLSRYSIEGLISRTLSEPKSGESLIEKESREYQQKLSQRNKENSLVSCSSRGERPKPYARQPAITDYYNPRKIVACNSRISDVRFTEEANELVAHPTQKNIGIERPATTSVSSVTTNESSSSCEHEQSQEQVSLHTMTIDDNAKLV